MKLTIDIADKDLPAIKNFLDLMAKALFRRDPVGISDAAAQTSPNTIVPGDQYATGFYNMATLLPSSKNAKTSGNFANGFNMRDAVGTSGTPIYIVNTAGDIFGSASLVTHGIQFNNLDPDYVNISGLSISAPALVRSGASQNGIQLASNTTGSHYILSNIVIDSPGASGVTANYGTGTKTYASIQMSNVRVFNAGQEGIIYAGNTGSTIDRGTTIIVNNCFSYTSQREGLQIEHFSDVQATNFTVMFTGQSSTSGQNNGVQSQDNNGYFKKAIVYKADGPAFNHFGHDFLYEDIYFSFYGNITGYSFIGRTDSGTSWTNSPNLNGRPVTFRRCHFEYLGAGNLPELVQIAERTANIIFDTCTFSSNITTVGTDIRVPGYTNTLTGMTIGSNGNAYATVPAPTFRSVIFSDYANHGVCTSNWHFDRRMGYQTP